MKTRMNTPLFTILALTAALTACSTTPDKNNALEQARTDFKRAQANPQVTTLAADELKQASDSLVVTEGAWSKGEETATVDHLAYLTKQRVTIAEESASSRASQAITAGAAAERDKMRLALRTLEADTAKQGLADADTAAILQKERTDAQVSDLEMQLKELNAKKTERGLVVTLSDVLFDTGKAELKPNSNLNMSKLAEVLKTSPDSTALIEGHTDSVGNASFNYALSQLRADAVMSALINLGVKSSRLSTLAHGADMPTADNSTALGRQMNRRVEILFTEEKAVTSQQPDLVRQ
jgi:outer membrane protein OmpA-like peptidoglycan-associated protein